MTPRANRVLACFLGALALANQARPEALGRLFFTPDERRALDGLKRAFPGGQRLLLEGKVSRSAGKDIYWINGAAADEAPRAAGPEDGSLRVGETLIPDSGERQDLLQGGQLVIHRDSQHR